MTPMTYKPIPILTLSTARLNRRWRAVEVVLKKGGCTMDYAKTLVISRHRDMWVLSDSKGNVCVSDSRDILSDLRAYAKIHQVRNLDGLKPRFSDSVLFLR